jgi:phage FluMu protein Com
MESVHELAAPQTVRPRADLELVQAPEVAPPHTIRCWQCNGLWTVARADRRYRKTLCPECRSGNVVLRTQFHNYWLTRFSMDEIAEMGRAIWG